MHSICRKCLWILKVKLKQRQQKNIGKKEQFPEINVEDTLPYTPDSFVGNPHIL